MRALGRLRLAKKSAACQNCLNAEDQISSGLRLQNETLSSGLTNFTTEAIGFVHREYQDAAAGSGFGNPLAASRPLMTGMVMSRITTSGFKAPTADDGLFPVCGLAANVPARPRLAEEVANPLAHDFVIVNNQDFRLRSNRLRASIESRPNSGKPQ